MKLTILLYIIMVAYNIRNKSRHYFKRQHEFATEGSDATKEFVKKCVNTTDVFVAEGSDATKITAWRLIALFFMLLSGSYIGASAENNTGNGSDHNTKPRRWAISAGFGQTTLDDETPDGQDFYLSDDLGNTFYVRGDYYLSDRFALTGGWYLESDGMMTDAADGIGYKHINLSGLEGGIKFWLCLRI